MCCRFQTQKRVCDYHKECWVFFAEQVFQYKLGWTLRHCWLMGTLAQKGILEREEVHEIIFAVEKGMLRKGLSSSVDPD